MRAWSIRFPWLKSWRLYCIIASKCWQRWRKSSKKLVRVNLVSFFYLSTTIHRRTSLGALRLRRGWNSVLKEIGGIDGGPIDDTRRENVYSLSGDYQVGLSFYFKYSMKAKRSNLCRHIVVVNVPSFAYILWKIVKPLLPARAKDRVSQSIRQIRDHVSRFVCCPHPIGATRSNWWWILPCVPSSGMTQLTRTSHWIWIDHCECLTMSTRCTTMSAVYHHDLCRRYRRRQTTWRNCTWRRGKCTGSRISWRGAIPSPSES